MEMSITIDSRKYMKFDDLYDIHEFEENAIVVTMNIDDAYQGYTFRMELENRQAKIKDMVYLQEDGTFTIPVNLLTKGLLKFQGVFLKTVVITDEEGNEETSYNVVAKTNRIMTTVKESINADNYITETYSNVIQEMRGKLFADVVFDEENDDLAFYSIDGELLRTVGLSIGGLSHTVDEHLD